MASNPAAFDQRPLKRLRNGQEGDPHGQVIDHIFIADGVSSKKQGVKKTPLSCCECRRLKLKCDRNFPCASCKKRGCAEICPDGVLVSGKGTRFILANTEQLHGKIHEMSERIRVLEDSLRSVHRNYEGHMHSCSGRGSYGARTQSADLDEEGDDDIPIHPLLTSELLNIKSTMGLYSGGGQNGNNKQDTPPGKRPSLHPMDVDHPSSDSYRASSEDTATVSEGRLAAQRHLNGEHSKHDSSQSYLPPQVARISDSFPMSPPHLAYSPDQEYRRKDDYRNIPLRDYIRSQLPRKEDAEYLWEQARRNALWQFNPHSSPTFFPTLINHVYTSNTTELCTRRLALLLMILAVGCHVDLNGPPGVSANCASEFEKQVQFAEHYHQLGRAALCEIPIMEDTNVDVVLALVWETWYLLVFSDKKKAAGYAWGMMGLTVKLAQSIGLHRNNGKAKVIPEEEDKRRTLFWELLSLDTRLSLSLGRPPSLTPQHIDCPRPSYAPDDGVDPAYSLHMYHEWNHNFYIYCQSPVLDAITQPASSLAVATVLDLDRRIRDFPIPDALRTRTGYESRGQMMQKGSISIAVETVLLQLHRSSFLKAVSGFDEAFNRSHRYAPSVVAVFLSASRMIAAVQDLYKWEPRITSRIVGFWSNAFSSAVALSLLVCRAPFTCLSPAALQELERARTLFRRAKDECPRANQVLPIMEPMIDKANDVFHRWSTNQPIPTMILRHTLDDRQRSFDHPRDPFAPAHSSLAQCIAEVHERAKILFPLRKPCQCSASVANCPPSHSWAPPPVLPNHHPVLPPEAPVLHSNEYSRHSHSNGEREHRNEGGYSPGRHDADSPPNHHSSSSVPSARGKGLYGHSVLPNDSPALPLPPPISSTLPPSSKMAIVDTLNFDLGAISSSSEPTWMAFF